MKIHEYQAKKLMGDYGVPVPKGGVAATPAEARKIASELKGKVVIKAQVHAGGRGKAGGIKTASSPDEAERLATQLLGTRLVTHQTSAEGVPVRKVLVEEAMDIKRELYLGIVIDNSAGAPVMMASEAGGMEIEQVAMATPEKILKAYIDPVVGFQPYQARSLAQGLNLDGDLSRTAITLMAGLSRLFREKDCSLAEINPLVVTTDGRLLALDAKLNFDDNALFRHPEVVALRDTEQEDPIEVEASKHEISYIKLDGTVGCMVNGAGLAMATMDIIKQVGAEPANFLDVGGGASAEQIASAFKILVSDPKVDTVLVNVFGGILRCDIAATGILNAVKEVEVKVPIVVRMRGTNMEEGMRMLRESGLGVIVVNDLREAANKVKELTKGKR